MSDRQLVFLVGAPRSGTTWLQLLLSQSDAIASVNETHLFSGYLSSLFGVWRDIRRSKRDIGLHHFLDEDEYFSIVRQIPEQVFDKIQATKPGATVILEKTPAHGRCHERILQLYPDAYFIHMIRDPRSVVASLCSAAAGWGSHWASPSVVKNAYLWESDVSAARSIAARTEKYIEVRFEDLKESPERQIHRIFDFLGQPISEEQCHSFAQKSTLSETAKITDAWDASKEPAGFFRSGKTDSWKTDLKTSDISVIERIAGDMARELGYAIPPGRSPSGNIRKMVYDSVTRWERYWAWQKIKLFRRL